MSKAMIDQVEVSTYADHVGENLVAQLEATLMAEKIGEQDRTVNFKWPSTWWQMLKNDYAPEWFTNRWPVEFTTRKRTVRFTKKAVYPKLTQGWPNETTWIPLYESEELWEADD